MEASSWPIHVAVQVRTHADSSGSTSASATAIFHHNLPQHMQQVSNMDVAASMVSSDLLRPANLYTATIFRSASLLTRFLLLLPLFLRLAQIHPRYLATHQGHT